MNSHSFTTNGEGQVTLTASSWLVRSTRFCRHFAAACLLRSRRIWRRASSSGVSWKTNELVY